jgi:hypothetical protein
VTILFAWAKTQRLNIDEQLRAGVRFLDIRLCGDGGTDQKDGSIHVSHTLVIRRTGRYTSPTPL